MRNFDNVWEAGLMDISYVLTVIDVISKYAWVELVKDKTSRNVADAFARILSRSDGNQYVFKLIKVKNLSVTSCEEIDGFFKLKNCAECV